MPKHVSLKTLKAAGAASRARAAARQQMPPVRPTENDLADLVQQLEVWLRLSIDAVIDYDQYGRLTKPQRAAVQSRALRTALREANDPALQARR